MVDRWERLNEKTISIYIKGRELDSFRVKPGQFAIFRFLNSRLAFQAHPFSFSGADKHELRITVKASGDYTEDLSEKIKEGTPVFIDGPHGVFTLEKTKKEKLVFIAGGVGITPFRMLVEQAIADGRDVILLYGAKKSRELVFKDELEGLAGNRLRLVWVLSSETSWLGESGRIDEEKIRRLVPDYAERAFFLCGPGPMTQNLRRTLKQLRIKEKDIYFEKFSLS